MDSENTGLRPTGSGPMGPGPTGPTLKKEPSREQDPKKLVGASYECMKKILELDTQSTIADMNLMEAINNSSTLKFRDVSSYVDTLKGDAAAARASERKLAQTGGQLSKVERRVAALERLVDQLDEWSSELEVKARRSRRRSRQ